MHDTVSVVCSNVKCSSDISISNVFLEKKKEKKKPEAFLGFSL